MQCDVDTPVGPAWVLLDMPAVAAPGVDPPAEPMSLLALGHGAGGGIEAADLLAVRDLAVTRGVAVARIVQPYRVAGRRAPAPAKQLDAAWTAVIAGLRAGACVPDGAAWDFSRLPLICGGRSSGARVACRTAVAVGAVGLVGLAFPLHPPGKPERSRADELRTGLPTIVVNGDRDPFGRPDPVDQVTVEVLPGADHSLRKVAHQAAEIVLAWLAHHSWARRAP